MWPILLALLPLLLQLLALLLTLIKSGKKLPAREARRLAKIIGACNKISAATHSLGVKVENVAKADES